MCVCVQSWWLCTSLYTVSETCIVLLSEYSICVDGVDVGGWVGVYVGVTTLHPALSSGVGKEGRSRA